MSQNQVPVARPLAPAVRPLVPGGNGSLAPRPPMTAPDGANGNGARYEMPSQEAVIETPVQVFEKLALDEVHIDELLQHVLNTKGSDLHLAVGKPPCVRIHGKVKELKEYHHMTAPVLQRIIYDILSDEQIQRFENDLELDFAYTLADGSARWRVNAYKDKGYLAAAMRAIPTKIPNPEELGLPTVIMELANRPRGLMLVTGPTGSGKSTTLAAVIDRINSQHEGHISPSKTRLSFCIRTRNAW
jgi:twitching motility protein PilT